MATPTYAINGGAAIPGVISGWQRIPKRTNADGVIDYMPYAINTWEIPLAEMAIWLAIQALLGQTLTSLDTTDIDSRNDAKNYTSAELATADVQHVGLQARNIRLEFWVKVS
jgi:hypothetical protein